MFSGVLIRTRSDLEKSANSADMTTPIISESIMLIAKLFFIRRSSLAPNAWETMTAKPFPSPMEKPTTMRLKPPTAPRAASASTPTNLPTTMVSTVAYTCWNRFPKKRGSVKPSRSLSGEPTVMSFSMTRLYISKPAKCQSIDIKILIRLIALFKMNYKFVQKIFIFLCQNPLQERKKRSKFLFR